MKLGKIARRAAGGITGLAVFTVSLLYYKVNSLRARVIDTYEDAGYNNEESQALADLQIISDLYNSPSYFIAINKSIVFDYNNKPSSSDQSKVATEIQKQAENVSDILSKRFGNVRVYYFGGSEKTKKNIIKGLDNFGAPVEIPGKFKEPKKSKTAPAEPVVPDAEISSKPAALAMLDRPRTGSWQDVSQLRVSVGRGGR